MAAGGKHGSWRHAWQWGTCMAAGDMHGRGCAWQGVLHGGGRGAVCVAGDMHGREGVCMAGETATAAHSMHSCI